MKKKVVVLGGGHNGLTAAALLSRRGYSVTVLEKRGSLGGIADFWPYTSQVRGDVVDALNLESFGLKFSRTPLDIYLPQENRFVSESAHFKKYQSWMDRARPFLSALFSEKTFSLDMTQAGDWFTAAKTALKLRGMGEKDMTEFMQVAPMPAKDFLMEMFPSPEDDAVRGALALPAVWGGVTGPWAPMSTLNLLAWEGTQERVVDGGSQAYIQALQKAATAYGVDIRTHASVEEINVSDFQVTGVTLQGGEALSADYVFSSLNPKTTFFQFVKPENVPLDLEKQIHFIRSRGNTCLLRLKLKQAPVGKREWTHARVIPSLQSLEKSFDALKYRELPERFALDLHLSSEEEGLVLKVLAFGAPYWLKEGWEEKARTKTQATILEQLVDAFSDSADFKNSIIQTEFLSPHDLESQYGLWEGNLFHGESAPDQLLMMRPIPSCAQYQTPIEGLFLCGSGSHPGGGLTGAPGALAAQTLIKKKVP